MNVIKERYSGIQTILKACGDEGCHFLTLCSIADEWRYEHKMPYVDLIAAIRQLQSNGLMTDDFYIKDDGTNVLSLLTEGKKWTRKNVESLPVIHDNDYTEVVYFNPRTQYKHYRRRSHDTRSYSTTVAEGYILEYRIYTVHD